MVEANRNMIAGIPTMKPGEGKANRESHIIYGHHGTGKSALLADAVNQYPEGEGVLLVTRDEEPLTTYEVFGVGDCVITVNSYITFKMTYAPKLQRANLKFVGLDSLNGFVRLIMDEEIGSNKYPVTPTEWNVLHDATAEALSLLKGCAEMLVMVAAADRSADRFTTPDAQKPNLVTPNLPGAQAVGCQGWVPFVAYLSLKMEAERLTNRVVSYVLGQNHLARSNGAKLVNKVFQLPVDGPGSWNAIRKGLTPFRAESDKFRYVESSEDGAKS